MGRNALIGPATDYIAGELRAQKSRKQWTFDYLEQRSGLARSTIDRALKGHGALAIEALVPLAQAMELDLAALMREAMRRAELASDAERHGDK